MSPKQRRLLVEMMDECFPSITEHDDHNGDWRSASEDEGNALWLACLEVLESRYASDPNHREIVLRAAFELLSHGYQECAA